MEASQFIRTVAGLHEDARRRGLYFQICDSADVKGRRITIGGHEMVWFGSCSYLGLESHPQLIEASVEATRRYGTQFASSRGYVSAPPYRELEECLNKIFGGAVLLGQTTTLAHISAFDVLTSERDALVLDHQVHASVGSAATHARARGTHVERVRHEELQRTVEVVKRLSATHDTVWFCTDGVTSMYGDMAPFELLYALLDAAPNVRLYIDDAHGMSWDGLHGRGSFLNRMPLNERVVVATSLSKGFAGSGGALIFSSREEAEKVRLCGSTMVFSGPLQPPILGATLGSARLHLGPELPPLQEALRVRVRHLNERLIQGGVPPLVVNDTPITFVGLGLPRVACQVAARLAADGLFINVSMYPSVPMKRAGIRIALTATHTLEEIGLLADSLARHVPAVLAEEGFTRAQVDALFERAVVSGLRVQGGRTARLLKAHGSMGPSSISPPSWRQTTFERDPDALTLHHHRSIHALDEHEWNSMLGATATCSWHSMKLQEQVFTDGVEPEDRWEFHYFVVREPDGTPVCAAPYVLALGKDDIFIRGHISREVERRREVDPHFLCSLAASIGTGLSEGNHLYLNRAGPWRAGLHRLLEAADAIYEQRQAAVFVIRDLPQDDEPLHQLLTAEGFVRMSIPHRHLLSIDWLDEDGYHASMGRRKRKHLRDMRERSEHLELTVYGDDREGGPVMTPELAGTLHRLYLDVAGRKYRINSFPLPEELVLALASNPAWEVVTLSVPPEHGGPGDGHPISWYAAHKQPGHYTPLLCGVDYDYLTSHSAYRQLLYQAVLRGRALGATQLHLGMDAEVEKQRLGAVAEPTCIYLRSRDHFNATLLQELIAELSAQALAHSMKSRSP